MSLSGKEVMDKLTEAGFKGRKGKGRHIIMKKIDNSNRVVNTTTVPWKNNIPIGTLKNIEKQSGVKLR